MVKFDANVGRIRAVLTFQRAEIESLERKKLPPGFYDPPSAPAKPTKAWKRGQVPYLEIPIVGNIGEEILADAIGLSLRYAKRHSIQHVVFLIDSTGGSVDEALHIYDKMKASKGKVKLHALVKNSVGPAMAITAWCDTIHVQEGSEMGGRGGTPEKLPKKFAKEDIAVVRAQLADKVARETGRSPQGAAVLRAMIDPEETLYAWKAVKKMTFARRKPADVADDDLILAVGEGEVLRLSYEQCVALGVPALEGGSKALGDAFGIKGWVSGGDYAKKTLQKAADRRRDRADAKAARFEAKVERNIKRREETEAYINKNLQKAASWDPTAASYETYKKRWHWGWGITGQVDTGQLTDESQREWRTRSDACAHYLVRAVRGLQSMKRYEKDAETLGLEPTYGPGDIDQMLGDMKKRATELIQHRKKETNE